jgi:hypothetical protein
MLACARQSGHRRRMNVLDLVRSRRQKIIASVLMTQGELDELDVAARSHRRPGNRAGADVVRHRLGPKKPD